MTTHDTRSQLLAGIAAHPDEDTPRLMYADWLDERGDQPDDALRAEFIRLQFRLSQPFVLCSPVCSQEYGHADSCELELQQKLHDRERELLDAYPEWSQCRCPECGGKGIAVAFRDGRHTIVCSTCGGAGDLFAVYVFHHDRATEPHTVTFARGFPDGITCTLAEAFGTDSTPTPWAVEVVKQTPVVRFSMTDQTPIHRDSAKNGPFGSGLVWDWSSAHVPYFLIREMAASHPDNVANTPGVDVWWVEFSTESEARDALALAAGRLVRRHAHKERT